MHTERSQIYTMIKQPFLTRSTYRGEPQEFPQRRGVRPPGLLGHPRVRVADAGRPPRLGLELLVGVGQDLPAHSQSGSDERGVSGAHHDKDQTPIA